PPPYYASISNRIWIEPSGRAIEPDVDVLRPNGPPRAPAPASAGATAVAVAVRPGVVVVRAPRAERKETLIDIFADPGGERLVTTVEVLSLSNKERGTEGRRLYLRKQREVVDEGRAHLVEIDLLRGGAHTTAVPLEALQAARVACDYHVCVHRF